MSAPTGGERTDGLDDMDWYDDDDTCPDCHGEGGFHDCGEDVCCCLHKDEHTDMCGTCRGTGHV